MAAVAADGEAEVADAEVVDLAVVAVLGPAAACRGPRHRLAARHRSAAAAPGHREASLGRLAAVHPVLAAVALAPLASLPVSPAVALGRVAAQAAVWRIVLRPPDSLPARVPAPLISDAQAESAKGRESVNCQRRGPVVPAALVPVALAQESAAALALVVVPGELVKVPVLVNFPRIDRAAALAR